MKFISLILFFCISINFIEMLKTRKRRKYVDVRNGVRDFALFKYYLMYISLAIFSYLSINERSIVNEETTSTGSSFYIMGFYVASSLLLLVLIISIVSILLVIRYRKNRIVVISITTLATLSITVTIFDAFIKFDGFTLYEDNTIKHQEFNLYSQGELTSTSALSDIIEVTTIDGFESGKQTLPEYHWISLEQRLSELNANAIIVSGFSDPHKTKSEGVSSNLTIAYGRALAVREKLKTMNWVKDNKIPIYIMSNGIEKGVKLRDSQVREYASERKVKVYVGI